MVHDTTVRHHQQHRKGKKEDRLKQFMDKAVYAAGFFGLAMTIPQIAKIWIGRDASGVSLISWTSYFLIAFVWISYGVVHKEKPIIVTYSAWILFYALIIVGIIMYG